MSIKKIYVTIIGLQRLLSKIYMKIYLAIILTIFFGSCSNNYYKKLGNVSEKAFYQEIPFSYDAGLLLIDIEIDGETFQLGLDTGAEYNVIDKRLAAKINYKRKDEIQINTTTSKVNNIQRIVLPEINIGGIAFKNTTGVIMDLSAFDRFIACPKVQGLIGNNLMRKANWQIDYEKKVIKITDQPSKLTTSDNVHALTMNSGQYGNVHLNLTINNKTYSHTFDTGYSGNIRSRDTSILKKYKHFTYAGITGANASGIVSNNKQHKVFVDQLELNGITIDKQHVIIDPNSSALVGNDFYDNYKVTILWDKDLLLLDPVNSKPVARLHPFEMVFSPDYDSKKVVVNSVFLESPFYEAISPGTTIVTLEGHNLENATESELCTFWQKEWVNLKKKIQLNAVINNNGEQQNIVIKRMEK